MDATAFPLAWPNGWKRSGSYSTARFKSQRRNLTVAEAIDRLEKEVERLIGYSETQRLVISTNVQPTLRGTPRSNQPEPKDPGVAIYFIFQKKHTVLACDKWNRVADNLAAIAAHIECLRGIARYGVGSLEQAFRGYQQLEDFTKGVPWTVALGFKPGDAVSIERAEARFKELALKHHPDRGGDHLQMAQITQAIAEARKELRA